MSITARHKKPGGFRKLVNSLELTPEDKREKILETFRQEDPEFVAEVTKCIFSFEEFKLLNAMIVTDVVVAMKPEMRTLAVALYKCKDHELLGHFQACMPSAQAAAFRDETGMLAGITVGEQKGARYRVIEKARELQNSGVVMIKKYSPLYADL